MKASNEDEMGTFSFTSDICDPFWPALAFDYSQIIILYTRYVTQVYFTFLQNTLRYLKSECITEKWF